MTQSRTQRRREHFAKLHSLLEEAKVSGGIYSWEYEALYALVKHLEQQSVYAASSRERYGYVR